MNLENLTKEKHYENAHYYTGQLSGSPAVLHIPVLQPNLRSEQLLVAVDTHTGVLLPHVPQYPSCHIMVDLQHALNHDKSKVDDLISELRYIFMHLLFTVQYGFSLTCDIIIMVMIAEFCEGGY